MTVNHEDAIAEFAEIARRWQVAKPDLLTLLNEFVSFYRDTRVTDASVDDDGDVFSIVCGPIRQLGIPKFGDYRGCNAEDDDIDVPEGRFAGATISRTVYPYDVNDTEHFYDDHAFEMAARLYFRSATGDEPFQSLEVSRPSDLDARLPNFLTEESVAAILDQPPSRIEVFVGGAG